MTFWKIVFGVIVSLGGVGGIVTLIIKFCGNMIAERLSKKYELKLNKELESLKSNLARKNFISKTRFDTEFKIYRELSKSFFNMTKNISIMIPVGCVNILADREARKKYEDEIYSTSCNCFVCAQDTLYQNVPFIPKEFCDDYNEILRLCRRQIDAYNRRFDVLSFVSQLEKENFTDTDYERTDEIKMKLKALNDSIREYLSNLVVVE